MELRLAWHRSWPLHRHVRSYFGRQFWAALVLACLCFCADTIFAQDSAPAPDLTIALQTLRVGFFTLPPHAFAASGTTTGTISTPITGAAVELLQQHIAPRMGVRIEMVGPFPFIRLLNDFDERKLDAILLLAKTPDRESRFTYPSQPFWTMSGGLAVPMDSPLPAITSQAEVHNMRIGYTRNAWLPEFLKTSGAYFDFTSGTYATELNLEKLRNGRLDAVFGPDRCALECALNRQGATPHSRILDVPNSQEGLYTVFSKAVDPALVQRYEKALQEVLAKTPYTAIKDRYMFHYNASLPLHSGSHN